MSFKCVPRCQKLDVPNHYVLSNTTFKEQDDLFMFSSESFCLFTFDRLQSKPALTLKSFLYLSFCVPLNCMWINAHVCKYMHVCLYDLKNVLYEILKCVCVRLGVHVCVCVRCNLKTNFI